jgi:hypothetical protein
MGKFQGNPDDVKKRSVHNYTCEKIQINVKEILLISLTFENKVIEQFKWKLTISDFHSVYPSCCFAIL